MQGIFISSAIAQSYFLGCFSATSARAPNTRSWEHKRVLLGSAIEVGCAKSVVTNSSLLAVGGTVAGFLVAASLAVPSFGLAATTLVLLPIAICTVVVLVEAAACGFGASRVKEKKLKRSPR